MKPNYFSCFEKDYFAKENGIILVKCEPGYALAKVEISERHHNGAGIVHGGLLFTIADFVLGAATNSYGKVALTINSNISYFQKSESGTIKAEAKIIAKSNRLMHANVDITHEDGSLLANFKGTVYVTDTKIDF